MAVGLTAVALPAFGQKDNKFSDKDFIAKAASGGQFEVKASQMALQKSTNSDLKSFAQQMVNDHNRINQELTTLASRKGWALPTAMDQKHTETLNRLSKLQSTDFDKAFGDIQVRDHEEDVALFAQAAKEAQDADLRAWASKTLPTLREHLQMAQRIFKKIGS
jgi:putative membrane protein